MRILLKIGSNLLKTEEGDIDLSFISNLASQIKKLREKNNEVLIVSSGAVLCGSKKLGVSRPSDLRSRQAISAVGQAYLMHLYDSIFSNYGLAVGQVLLTSDVFSEGNEDRFENARETLNTLLNMGIIPIINENDSVAVSELVFGDNDFLAVYVGFMMEVDLIILLSTAGGLLDEKGRVIPEVESPEEAFHLVKGTGSEYGTGGMRTKLEATRLATSIGIPVIITGKEEKLLETISFKTSGTLFKTPRRKVRRKLRNIAMIEEPKGIIYIDDGAVKALRNGKSLLPAGVLKAEGSFKEGDAVTIATSEGIPVGKGKTNFSAQDINRIKGMKGEKVKELLGTKKEEIVHRDNLIVFT